MKKVLTIITGLFMILALQAQTDKFNITNEEWRADLKWLSETVHTDYSFLFKKITADDWDEKVAELYRDIPQLDEHEIIVGFAKLVAAFEWGHTRMDILPFGPVYNPAGFKRMPYNFYWFSDGLYVQGTHADYAGAVGARVIAIGGTPIDKALELVRPVVPVENEQFFRAFGLQYLQIPEVLHAQGITDDMAKTRLTLEKNGETFEVTYKYGFQYRDPYYDHSMIWEEDDNEDWVVARPDVSVENSPYWLKHADKHFWFEALEGKSVVYAQQNLVRDSDEETIAQFYERLFRYIEDNDIERLILDLRLNSGGDNFLNVSAIQEIIRSGRINRPGRFFVVIGRRTFSACQNFVNELETYTEAIFVGEPTAENVNMYGDNREIKLPNSGLTGRLSWVWWQDKAQWDTRQWTEPILAADLSFDDYMNNIDPVIDVILDYAGNGDPRDHMLALFEAGKMDELLEVSKVYVSDPVYRYISFEHDINRGGYRLLGAGRKEEAFQAFKLNTQLYPGSANAWDSFAEVHLEMGEIDEAVKLYKKALSMDPDGYVGNNAKQMLEKIAGYRETHGGHSH
jgi:tetratricopeptide (TPR) repeat protein